MCLTALVLEESILLVTLVYVLSLIMNMYDKSKQNKHSLKLQRLSTNLNDIRLCTNLHIKIVPLICQPVCCIFCAKILEG